METKKNLNNVQRKMLDEIYKEQFQKREDVIMHERALGLTKLTAKCLKSFAQDKDVKKLLEAGKTYYELQEKLKGKFSDNSVTVNEHMNRIPVLSVNTYRSYERTQFPEIEEYESETNRIRVALGEKKKEMRAKIYGVAASYEEVEKEISELLKDV